MTTRNIFIIVEDDNGNQVLKTKLYPAGSSKKYDKYKVGEFNGSDLIVTSSVYLLTAVKEPI